jgi:nicotinamide riboside kinase
MKIYFVGAHAVGKSTLGRYVSQNYSLPFISETARMVLSEKELQIDQLRYDMNLVDQYEEEVFSRQLAEENKCPDFVSDRSALDALAYTAQHTRVLTKLLNSSELPGYIERLKDPNSFIFFVRPSKATLKADGVREHLTWDGVIAIDAQVKFLLEMYGIRYFQINMDNMQERVRFIDAVLSTMQT